MFSDAAPRLLQENQKYLSQLTSLMQEAAEEQTKSIVVSSLVFSSVVEDFNLQGGANGLNATVKARRQLLH